MTTQPIRTLVSGVSTPHFIYLFIYFGLVSVISLVSWEQEDGAFLCPGPPSTSPGKRFIREKLQTRQTAKRQIFPGLISSRSVSLVTDQTATFC